MNDELVLKTHFPGPYSSRETDQGTEVYCTVTNNTLAKIDALVYDRISEACETTTEEGVSVRSQIIDGSDYSAIVSALIVTSLNASS